jgi:penicillin-binding protein 1A
MDAVLVKILAAALTFSQVATGADTKSELDPIADQQNVIATLRSGCEHMRRAFDIEDIKIDDLIATAMDDPEAIAGGHAVLRGINIGDLHVAYRQFCKNETVPDSRIDVSKVIEFYNGTMAELPDHARLKGMRLPGTSAVLDRKGERIADVYEVDHRRLWVDLADIPAHVQHAFVAAEDKRFHEHKGIDERALIRAFIGNLMQPGRPQGGSTITQQVVKNLLVGDEISYERKMREMVLASRVERTLTKSEILELYLNSIHLGRASAGVEMAARSYFGKPARDLTLAEGALLAGLTKGPNSLNPERHPDRAKARFRYVLARMQEDGAITPDEAKHALSAFPNLVPDERVERPSGSHFADYVARELRTTNSNAFRLGSYRIQSTLHPDLQRATELALQEGLARYEMSSGRVEFQGPETNLTQAIGRIEERIEAERVEAERIKAERIEAERIEAERIKAERIEAERLKAERLKAEGIEAERMEPEQIEAEKIEAGKIEAEKDTQASKPAWQQALENARLPIHDVQWKAAVVIERTTTRNRDGSIRVGIADGRTLPLHGNAAILRRLALYDVVLVHVTEGRGKAARAELRVRPVVQGAAVVLENKTGRILAMTGGFSYALSQLNRVTQSQRQPGSALKPLIYLAALQKGLQPNTLVRDEDITLPPIFGKREEDYWSPKNYDGGSSGTITMRAALENSRNLATVNLLVGGIADKAPASLDRICALAVELQIYKDCMRYYPFVLGAQGVRPIDLAVFYATVANEGSRPTPYTIETIEQNGEIVYRHAPALAEARTVDRASFYQLKTMLQGVVQRGTARRIAHFAPYVAGKTGTTDDENDAWFVGFTNDVTVAVWVGYDNADGRRRTLGGGRTGASVAVPIFEPVMQAVWAHHARKVALAPPSPQAKRLFATKADRSSGDRSNRGALAEYFRRDAKGRPVDTQHDLISRGSSSEATGSTRAPDRGRRQVRQTPDADRQAQRDAQPARPAWGWGSWGEGSGWGGWDQGSRDPSYGRRESAPVLRRY